MRTRLFAWLLAFFMVASLQVAHAGGPLTLHGGGSSNCTGQPAGIIANGLCDVALLKSNNGARVSTTNISTISKPAGVSYSSTTPFTTDFTGTGGSLSAVDNAGRGGFYFSGNGSWALTDFSLTSNSAIVGSGFPLGIGVTSGAGVTGNTNLDAEHGTIDGSGMAFGVTYMVQPHGGGTVKFGYTNFLHPARDPWVAGATPGANYIFDHDYFDAPCQNTTAPGPSGDHCEWLHPQGGTITISYSNFKASDGVTVGGLSGAFQQQTGVGTDPSTYTGGPLVFNMDHSVTDWGCTNQQTTNSAKAVFDDVTLNIGPGNVWCTATSAPTTGPVQQADITVSGLSGTFTSGDTLTATGGKSAPLLGPPSIGNTNLHLSTWGTGAHFAPGDVITATSGGTATVVSVKYHSVTVNNLGGNLDFSGNPVNP